MSIADATTHAVKVGPSKSHCNITTMTCSLANQLHNISKQDRQALIEWLQHDYTESIETILYRMLPGYHEHEDAEVLHDEQGIQSITAHMSWPGYRWPVPVNIEDALTEDQLHLIEEEIASCPTQRR
jgi:hypothetical protein